MLEEDLNLVGYSAVVGCVFPSVSKDHKILGSGTARPCR